MITVFLKNFNIFDDDFELTQDFYDNCLLHLDLNRLTCSCSKSNCLCKHGFYYRKIRTSHGLIDLRVLRVKCSCCGRTHAIMLSCIIPYSQFLFNQILKIIKKPMKALNHFLITFDIDEAHVRYIKKMFHLHWKNLLDHLKLLLDEHLPFSCFHHFKRQFMQMKASLNIPHFL